MERIAELAFQIAGSVDAVPEDARRAAQLAKADLVSGMVGEFPELQGLMGRYYAEAAGTKPEIARAIELHYKPKGPTDTVPQARRATPWRSPWRWPTSSTRWSASGPSARSRRASGDPYQLRRAALGVIRIVLENDLAAAAAGDHRPPPATMPAHLRGPAPASSGQPRHREDGLSEQERCPEHRRRRQGRLRLQLARESMTSQLLQGRSATFSSFFADRLKVHLRERARGTT